MSVEPRRCGLAGHASEGRRGDEVDLDAVTGSRGLEAAGEADHGSLGGRVREVLGQPEDARGGGHDDAAVTLSDHVWPCGTGGVERPDRVHGEVAGEVVLVGVRKPGPPDDAGVVDEDVEASESLEGGFDECPRTRSGCHVAAVGNGSSAGGDDLLRDGGRDAGVRSQAFHGAAQIVDHDAGSPGREQQRMGSADPTARTGDDRDAPLEAVRVHSHPAARCC